MSAPPCLPPPPPAVILHVVYIGVTDPISLGGKGALEDVEEKWDPVCWSVSRGQSRPGVGWGVTLLTSTWWSQPAGLQVHWAPHPK